MNGRVSQTGGAHAESLAPDRAAAKAPRPAIVNRLAAANPGGQHALREIRIILKRPKLDQQPRADHSISGRRSRRCQPLRRRPGPLAEPRWHPLHRDDVLPRMTETRAPNRTETAKPEREREATGPAAFARTRPPGVGRAQGDERTHANPTGRAPIEAEQRQQQPRVSICDQPPLPGTERGPDARAPDSGRSRASQQVSQLAQRSQHASTPPAARKAAPHVATR